MGRQQACVAWVNGRLLDDAEPVIRADDHALVGDGVFEAIRVDDGQPFALTRHLRRLAASAQPLAIDIDLRAVDAGIREVLATPSARRSPSWLRVTVTAGSSQMATAARGEPTVIVAVAPMAEWPPTTDVVVTPWARNDQGATAGLKTISYAENVIGLRFAHDRRADEALFRNTRGHLCEGAGSNVFVAIDGRLVTPPLSSGCLPGVTRELVLEWVPEIEEADVSLDLLDEIGEAFLTSTSRGVHPIRSFDGRRLPAPGPLTEKVMAVYAARSREDVDP